MKFETIETIESFHLMRCLGKKLKIDQVHAEKHEVEYYMNFIQDSLSQYMNKIKMYFVLNSCRGLLMSFSKYFKIFTHGDLLNTCRTLQDRRKLFWVRGRKLRAEDSSCNVSAESGRSNSSEKILIVESLKCHMPLDFREDLIEFW